MSVTMILVELKRIGVPRVKPKNKRKLTTSEKCEKVQHRDS